MDAQHRTFGSFWLLIGDKDGDRAEVFTLGTEGEDRSLPVFSFEEEALLFLRLGGLEGRWRTSETDAAALVLMLTETYRDLQSVVLDPFPVVGFDRFYKAASLLRERFLDLLVNPRRQAGYPPSRPAATGSR